MSESADEVSCNDGGIVCRDRPPGRSEKKQHIKRQLCFTDNKADRRDAGPYSYRNNLLPFGRFATQSERLPTKQKQQTACRPLLMLLCYVFVLTVVIIHYCVIAGAIVPVVFFVYCIPLFLGATVIYCGKTRAILECTITH